MPSWTCQGRSMPGGDLRQQMSLPGPPEYNGRIKHRDVAGDASPGPARYSCNGLGGTMPVHGRPLDEYVLWQKIKNVKVPKHQLPAEGRSRHCKQGSIPAPGDLPDAGNANNEP